MALLAALAATSCSDEPVAPGPELRVEVVSGQEQEGLEGLELPDPVVLRLVDAGGAAVSGEVVELTASAGGRVRPGTAVTGPTGKVEVRWTLGPAGVARQELRATSGGRAEAATVAARALPLARADRVILRGALGPPKGIILVQEHARGLDIVEEIATPDTVFLLQPRSDSAALVVFPTANALERREVAWTPAPDTVVVEMRPPVEVDVLVRVYVAPFEEMAAVARADLARTDALWQELGMGIRLGDVEILDRVEPGRRVNATPSGTCASPARERLELGYVHLVRNHPAAGQGCPPGQAFVGGESSEPYPYLVAHEFGHTFSLAHRDAGLMSPLVSGNRLSEGEIYQANFDSRSGLNVLFDAQPESQRRFCGSSLVFCLDAGYELGGR